MKDNTQIKFGILRIILDFIAIFFSWIIGYHVRIKGDFIPFVKVDSWIYYPNINDVIPLFLFSSLFFVILIAFDGHYKFDFRYSKTGEIFRLIFLNAIWCLLIIAFYALFKHQLFFSRILLFQVFFISIILITLFRFIVGKIKKILLKKGILVRNTLIVGGGKVLDIIRGKLYNSQYKIIGIESKFNENKKYKGIDEIWYIFKNEEEKNKILNYCQINQIGFSFIPNTEGVLLSKLKTSMVGGLPLLTIIPTNIHGWGQFLKRIIDIILSGIIIIILSPFLVIVSILIKIDSKGPIIYKSKRVGRNGKLFYMFKFRSMITEADLLKNKLIEKNHRTGPLFKIKNDPRITKFGRFLRRFSIDELPQLFNVIIGNMSLVGPRAHLPNEVEKYSELQKRVLTIKPGITGLSQINGRSDLEFEEEIRLDLQYIVHWSIAIDLQIIVQTPFILLKGEGAD